MDDENSWDFQEWDAQDRDATAPWRRLEAPLAVIAELFRPYLPERIPSSVRAEDAYSAVDPFERLSALHVRLGGPGTRAGETLAFFGSDRGMPWDGSHVYFLQGAGHDVLPSVLLDMASGTAAPKWNADLGLWSLPYEDALVPRLDAVVKEQGIRPIGELAIQLDSSGPPYGMH